MTDAECHQQAEQIAHKYHAFIKNPCPPEYHQFGKCPVATDLMKEMSDALAQVDTAAYQRGQRATWEEAAIVIENTEHHEMWWTVADEFRRRSTETAGTP